MADCPSTTQKYYITNAASPYCVLEVYSHNTDENGKIDLYTKNGGANQQWTFDSNGYITNVESGLVLQVELDPNDSTIQPGALVTQGTRLGSGDNYNQLWVYSSSHGYFTLWDPRTRDVVLAGQDNANSSGTVATVETVDSTLSNVNQQWTLSFAS